MDSLITAAALALASGDPLGALNRIALREDAPALALRGIAMAQLGEFPRARALLKRASHTFGPKAALSRARCVVAEAEVALAMRDLAWRPNALATARSVLQAQGDQLNAAHAQLLDIRRLLLTGQIDEAGQSLATLDPTPLPHALQATYELSIAGIALRRIKAGSAREALARALRAAQRAGIPALIAEVEAAYALLNSPAARLLTQGTEKHLTLDGVETLFASRTLIVDACRHVARDAHATITLASRPVLFALARQLAEAWPGEVTRTTLIAKVFRTQDADDSHRARLRVEIGRLRKTLNAIAKVSATRKGFVLAPTRATDVVVLAPPLEGAHGAVLALLADGESWSSSALALALGASQRNIQRSLEQLAATGKVQSYGRGRARRWTAPIAVGFTTSLLLPGPLPID